MNSSILLIRPYTTPFNYSENFDESVAFLGKKALMPPLELATVAALTPETYTVDIWDEPIHGLIESVSQLKDTYDIIGITGYDTHYPRIVALSLLLQPLNTLLVVGGPGVSTAPERYSNYFDILFVGEAEKTWPQFIVDYEQGTNQKKYVQTSDLDITESPAPRWQSLQNEFDLYMVASVQSTRGCPFKCDFCDVITIYGRKQRHKKSATIIDELITIKNSGVTIVFICDDNLYGDKKYYRSLLEKIIELNDSFDTPLVFYGQVDIRIAQDEIMLDLLANANFKSVLVGIESPNRESLEGVNARKNKNADFYADIAAFHKKGIDVHGSFIIGFDSDDADIFDSHFNYIQKAGIPSLNMNLLSVISETQLWKQVFAEERLLGYTDREEIEDALPLVNFIPKHMSRVELLKGYEQLLMRLLDWRNFEHRVVTMVSEVEVTPRYKSSRPPLNFRKIIGFIRFFIFVLDKQGRGTIRRLMRYTIKNKPHMMPTVMKLIFQNHMKQSQMIHTSEAIHRAIEEDTSLKKIPYSFPQSVD